MLCTLEDPGCGGLGHRAHEDWQAGVVGDPERGVAEGSWPGHRDGGLTTDGVRGASGSGSYPQLRSPVPGFLPELWLPPMGGWGRGHPFREPLQLDPIRCKLLEESTRPSSPSFPPTNVTGLSCSCPGNPGVAKPWDFPPSWARPDLTALNLPLPPPPSPCSHEGKPQVRR